MYCINPYKSNEQYNVFSVVDTTDGSEENMTKEELDTLIEAGIEIKGYEEAKQIQEETKNELKNLNDTYGEENVQTEFFNNDKKKDYSDADLSKKQDVLTKIEKSIETKIQTKVINRTSELSAHIKGELALAEKKGYLVEDEVNKARIQMETAFVKKHPELVMQESEYVAKAKELQEKQKKQMQQQLQQMQQVNAQVIEKGSDIDYTLYVFTVVGVVMNDDEVVAYNMVSNISDNVMYLKVDLLRKTMNTTKQKVQFTNAIYDKATGLLKTQKGTGLESIYPKIEMDFSLRNVNGLTITSLILDEETDLVLGAICFDGFGVRYNYTLHSILTYITKGNLNCNFKIQTGSIVPKHCIEGFEFPEVYMSIPKPEAVYNSRFGEEKPYVITEDTDCAPMITQRVYAFDEISENDFMASGEEKYQWASYSLKKIAPYYYTMFQAIEKVPVVGFGTMGVTEDKMIIDYQFLSQCSIAELVYLFIHEMSHIAMQHSIRQGRRNHELWNIACDLYINTVINQDYECRPGGPVSEIYLEEYTESETGEKKLRTVITHPEGASKGDDKSDYKTNKKSGFIKCPTYGVFLENIGESLDLGTATVERIYDKLAAENADFEKTIEDKSASQSGSNMGASQSGNIQSSNSQSGNSQSGNSQSGQPQVTQQDKNAIQQAIQQVQEGMKEGLEICEHSKASKDANKKAQSGIQNIQEGLKSNDINAIQKGFEKMQDGIADMQRAMNEASIAKSEKDMQSAIKEAGDRTGMKQNMQNLSKQMSSDSKEIRQGILKQNKTQERIGIDKMNNDLNTAMNEEVWQRPEVADLKSQIEAEMQAINESASVNLLRDGNDLSLSVCPDSATVQNCHREVEAGIKELQRGYESGDNNRITDALDKLDVINEMYEPLVESEYCSALGSEWSDTKDKISDALASNGVSQKDITKLMSDYDAVFEEPDMKVFGKLEAKTKKALGSKAKDSDVQMATLKAKRIFAARYDMTDSVVGGTK